MLRYMFVSYCMDQFGNVEDDLSDLTNLAERAARNYGLPAFWISCSCMPNGDGSLKTQDGRSVQEEVHDGYMRIAYKTTLTTY